MSNIAPVGRTNPPALSQGSRATTTNASDAPTVRQADQVEVSAIAKYLSKLAELPEVRTSLVDRIRAEIEAGTYDTSEKLDQALDELISDLD